MGDEVVQADPRQALLNKQTDQAEVSAALLARFNEAELADAFVSHNHVTSETAIEAKRPKSTEIIQNAQVDLEAALLTSLQVARPAADAPLPPGWEKRESRSKK